MASAQIYNEFNNRKSKPLVSSPDDSPHALPLRVRRISIEILMNSRKNQILHALEPKRVRFAVTNCNARNTLTTTINYLCTNILCLLIKDRFTQYVIILLILTIHRSDQLSHYMVEIVLTPYRLISCRIFFGEALLYLTYKSALWES